MENYFMKFQAITCNFLNYTTHTHTHTHTQKTAKPQTYLGDQGHQTTAYKNNQKDKSEG